jgi:membrane protein DedA with SNARE-associated domain
MFDVIKDWMTNAANTPYGLPVAAGLMALESMIAPVPSEFVMPPLGMVLRQYELHPERVRHISWVSATIATSIGSLIGSLLSYYMGYFGGKPLVMKIGKYLLVNEHHLDITTSWFKRWGGLTVFVCRFIPVVRHLISIPAGIAKMNLLKFCIYTVIGATLWNFFLMWLGYRLEEHINKVLAYRTPVDFTIAGLIVLGVVLWYWLHWRKPAKRELEGG